MGNREDCKNLWVYWIRSGGKKILIVVNGENKADIVERAFFGPVTPEVPASILQLHNDVTLVGDEAALAKIGI